MGKKVINPNTGRKIEVGGKVYHEVFGAKTKVHRKKKHHKATPAQLRALAHARAVKAMYY